MEPKNVERLRDMKSKTKLFTVIKCEKERDKAKMQESNAKR